MKFLLFLIASIWWITGLSAQVDDLALVTQTCQNYIDAFYQGDAEKLSKTLSPDLHKFGFWKNKENGEYGKPIHMSYEKALDYAARVKKDQDFAPEDAPQQIKVLDVMDKIAVAKVGAMWDIDYMLLAKTADG